MNMIIMRTFFQIFRTLWRKAAIIDGASDLQVLLLVILRFPSGMLTIGMFYAVGHWNSWFSSLIYLKSLKKYPLQLVLRQPSCKTRSRSGSLRKRAER